MMMMVSDADAKGADVSVRAVTRMASPGRLEKATNWISSISWT
jgi:hypothetical protein